jgi:hypothetical protein
VWRSHHAGRAEKISPHERERQLDLGLTCYRELFLIGGRGQEHCPAFCETGKALTKAPT